MPLSRRRVLALSGTVLTTGCLETGRTDSPTTDTTVTEDPPQTTSSEPHASERERSSTATSDCTSGVTITTDPYAPVDQIPVDLDQLERSIVATAASDGSADHETYGQAPLRGDVIVRYEGAFYRTEYSETGVAEVPAYTLDLYWEDGQTAPEAATVVPFEDLSPMDRTVLETAALGDGEGREGDGLPQQTLSIRQYPAPYPGDVTDSELVGNRTWVRWRDRTMRVDVAGESESTTERRTFSYTLEQVGRDEEAFRAFVAEHYVVTLGDLSASQRSILSEAIADRYEECRPESDALAAIRERLTDADPLPHPRNDSWYVEFEGERYRFQIIQWVH